MAVELLVEGYTDEVFVRECYGQLGIPIATVYGKRGIDYIRAKANAFAVRGRYCPILILADFMDMKSVCPSEARHALVQVSEQHTLVRLAVRELEAWVLASRAELARFLRVPLTRVPENPDLVVDPKGTLVNLARSSSSSKIREMFVPRLDSSASVGIGYVEGLSAFMADYWDLDSARSSSESLSRFVTRSTELFLAP